MGRAGQDQPDGARKYSMPRSDVKVTLDGVGPKAGFAVGSWAAFQKMGNQAEVKLRIRQAQVSSVVENVSQKSLC